MRLASICRWAVSGSAWSWSTPTRKRRSLFGATKSIRPLLWRTVVQLGGWETCQVRSGLVQETQLAGTETAGAVAAGRPCRCLAADAELPLWPRRQPIRPARIRPSSTNSATIGPRRKRDAYEEEVDGGSTHAPTSVDGVTACRGARPLTVSAGSSACWRSCWGRSPCRSLALSGGAGAAEAETGP